MILEENKDRDLCVVKPFPVPNPGDTLRWWYESPTQFRYSAYVVQAAADYDGGDSFRFRFVHKTTAAVSARGPHTIDLRDATAVWRAMPSTIINDDTGARIRQGECALLFLRWRGLAEPCRPEYELEYEAIRAAELADTGGGTGKWPKSAGGGGHAIAMVEKIRKALLATQGQVGIAQDSQRQMLLDLYAAAIDVIE